VTGECLGTSGQGKKATREWEESWTKWAAKRPGGSGCLKNRPATRAVKKQASRGGEKCGWERAKKTVKKKRRMGGGAGGGNRNFATVVLSLTTNFDRDRKTKGGRRRGVRERRRPKIPPNDIVRETVQAPGGSVG